jgi:hypothetical protein
MDEENFRGEEQTDTSIMIRDAFPSDLYRSDETFYFIFYSKNELNIAYVFFLE